jgi:hypothetical protein
MEDFETVTIDAADLNRQQAQHVYAKYIEGTNDYYRWIGDYCCDVDIVGEAMSNIAENTYIGQSKQCGPVYVVDPRRPHVDEWNDYYNHPIKMNFDLDIGYIQFSSFESAVKLEPLKKAGFTMQDCLLLKLTGIKYLTVNYNRYSRDYEWEIASDDLLAWFNEEDGDFAEVYEAFLSYAPSMDERDAPFFIGLTIDDVYSDADAAEGPLRELYNKLRAIGEWYVEEVGNYVQGDMDYMESFEFWYETAQASGWDVDIDDEDDYNVILKLANTEEPSNDTGAG